MEHKMYVQDRQVDRNSESEKMTELKGIIRVQGEF